MSLIYQTYVYLKRYVNEDGSTENAHGSIKRAHGSTNNVHGSINFVGDSTTKCARSCHQIFHGFIIYNFVQGSICIIQDSTTSWSFMCYSPNGSWSINNDYDIRGSTNAFQGSLIACGVICIVHGSTYISPFHQNCPWFHKHSSWF